MAAQIRVLRVLLCIAMIVQPTWWPPESCLVTLYSWEQLLSNPRNILFAAEPLPIWDVTGVPIGLSLAVVRGSPPVVVKVCALDEPIDVILSRVTTRPLESSESSKAKRQHVELVSTDDNDFQMSSSSKSTEDRDEHKLAYKPPDVSLFGKTEEMKFKVESGKIQWFKGQVMNYDGHTGKYGIYFPSDGETVYVFPDDRHEVYSLAACIVIYVPETLTQ